MAPIIIVPIIAVVIIAGVIYSIIAAKKRREAMALLAQQLGLSYDPRKDRSVDDHLNFLNQLNIGSNRYATNLMNGNYQGHDVELFDYHYQTGSGKNTHHHHLSCFILRLEISCPELIITKEGFFSKIAQAIGFDDIDFESHEFSRRFSVKSKDKKFAYDVCNAQMIEFLLANTDLSIEIEFNTIALIFPTQARVESIRYNLDRLIKFRSLLPEYLFNRK